MGEAVVSGAHPAAQDRVLSPSATEPVSSPVSAHSGNAPLRVERIGCATLYLGDSRELVSRISADTIITSPPYAQQRDYGAKVSDWRKLVSGVLTGVQDSGSTQILVNLGMVHRDGEVLPYWDDLIADMRAENWRQFGWYVWDQGPGMPGDWQGRLAPAHEFIFHFNRVARKPNKTVPAKYAGHVRAKPQGGLRRPDGAMSGWSHGVTATQQNKIPDSVVRVMRHKHVGGIEAGHPAVYPVEFAEHMVLAYSEPGDVVMDPFLGSGSTGVAALAHGRQFVGIEIHEPYFDIACERIERAQRQGSLFGEAA